MPELVALEDILILLGLAIANAYIFSRFRQSPIVGYLATGLLVGPYGFNLIKGIHEVEMVAEVGVILLLFTIGLEFSYKRITRLKRLLFSAGSTQVTITGVTVFSAALLFGENISTAVTLGMVMALSSTAIVLKLLLERGEVDTAHGRISLGILLFQDMCVILFIVILPMLSAQTQVFSALTLAKSFAILFSLFLFVRYLLKRLLRSILKTRAPELFRLTILGLVLGTAWATAQAGLSLALGAFLAGLALAESDSSHQVMADVIPFRDVFLAVFFISVGMLVDIRLLLSNLAPVMVGLILISVVKTMAGSIAGLIARYPFRTSLVAGLMTFQVGEFSFILLEQARDVGVIAFETYQLALSIVALSMMITPLIFREAHRIAAILANCLGHRSEHSLREEQERTANLEGHVIIAGYGLAGRNVAKTLREMRIPYIHIELNGEMVRQARKTGEIILHGDATTPTVLEGAGVHRARAVVFAINDQAALYRAIPTARELNAKLFILARTHFVLNIDQLIRLGADEIITDEFSAGLEMAAFLLRAFDVPEGRVLKILSSLREEHHQRYQQKDWQTRNLTGYLSVLDGGQIEIQAVPKDSPCIGKSLRELDFRAVTQCSIMGIVRQERVIYSPPADLQIEPGDTLMLLGAEDDIHKAREFVHGHPL
ncbi:MAG: cation:proton antiporter [Deltaproteobacteria bacterium]|jgi:CPA2 family monovalent cation:H+ antiporter-2|nr:cation:proton antiporter [Deltaproteobacteria bacterium]